MKRFCFALVVLSLATAASAQAVVDKNIAKLDFTSASQAAIIPVGEVGAGGPVLISYQASVFPITADVSTGTPLVVGPVFAKALAVSNPAATALRLTFAQMGIATGIPACTAVLPATCPVYSVVLIAIGPNNRTLPGLASESDSFTLAAPVLLPTTPPVPPSLLKIVP